MMKNVAPRFRAFIEKSPSAREPPPRIERYGFANARIVPILNHPNNANCCVVTAIHDELGHVFALLYFTTILRKQDYRKAMALKYELENIKEELVIEKKVDATLPRTLASHLFLFHAALHPNFIEGKEHDEALRKEDVHLVCYHDDDGLYVNRRVVLDENLANASSLLEGLGVPVYNIGTKHQGTPDEAILLLAQRKEEGDVLITRDKELADIARKHGRHVIELDFDETVLDSLKKQRLLGMKVRKELEKMNFTIIPTFTILMTNNELTTFLKPVENLFLTTIKTFLARGVPQVTVPANQLSLTQRALLACLEKESMIALTPETNDVDVNDAATTVTSGHVTLKMIPEHPTWHWFVQSHREMLVGTGNPEFLGILAFLSSTKHGLVDLQPLLEKQLVHVNGSLITITEQGRCYHHFMEMLISTRENNERSRNTDNSARKPESKAKNAEITEKDKRAFMELFVRLSARMRTSTITETLLKQEWVQQGRSPRRFVPTWSALVQEGLLTRKFNAFTLGRKIYQATEYLDLAVLHEILLRKEIHYLELKNKMIEKGCHPVNFDHACEMLKKQRQLIDDQGFLRPHSLLKNKKAAHFLAFTYVMSAPTQDRSLNTVKSYLREKIRLNDLEAKTVIDALLADEILVAAWNKNSDEQHVRAGPNAKIFARLITAASRKQKAARHP